MKLRTLAVVSGGMDSTVLAHYIKESSTHTLTGILSVDYGQRHKRELRCAQSTAQRLQVPWHCVDLSSLTQHISKSALTGDAPVPHGHYAAENMKATVVPNRNMILMALAVGVAISNDAQVVAYGAHAGDHDVYPDCREAFVTALKVAVDLCDYNPPDLYAPFIHVTKADIVAVGATLKVDFEDTWTCYEGAAQACGRCGTCVERLEAFAFNNLVDPLSYADRNYWRTVLTPLATAERSAGSVFDPKTHSMEC